MKQGFPINTTNTCDKMIRGIRGFSALVHGSALGGSSRAFSSGKRIMQELQVDVGSEAFTTHSKSNIFKIDIRNAYILF